MNNRFFNLERRAFSDLLNHFLHPSGNITLPAQLKGRTTPMKQMLDCFETEGSHAFIWGPRGVGKTSLGHTACEQHKSDVILAAAIACEKSTSFNSILNDILRDVVYGNKVLLKDKHFNASLDALGVRLSANKGAVREKVEIDGTNHAVALLCTIFSLANYPNQTPTIIIDEFDKLENKETLASISSLLKQLSVNGLKLNFVFCGVARNLDELLGSHESVERYVYGVELNPLTHDAIWEIITDIQSEFGIEFHRGQKIRISQISGGYAGFAHLILKNTLRSAYDMEYSGNRVTEELFRLGIGESAQQAATRLKTAYENAIKKGTDRYIEVLWALANDEHLDRQFKSIQVDYKKIMEKRPHRSGYDSEKNNGQDLRNALNNLSNRGFLKKGKTGWYEFVDPMLRSYVRLVAEREGIELSDESFPA